MSYSPVDIYADFDWIADPSPGLGSRAMLHIGANTLYMYIYAEGFGVAEIGPPIGNSDHIDYATEWTHNHAVTLEQYVWFIRQFTGLVLLGWIYDAPGAVRFLQQTDMWYFDWYGQTVLEGKRQLTIESKIIRSVHDALQGTTVIPFTESSSNVWSTKWFASALKSIASGWNHKYVWSLANEGGNFG